MSNILSRYFQSLFKTEAGELLPSRKVVKVIGGTLFDNPETEETELTVGGGGSGLPEGGSEGAVLMYIGGQARWVPQDAVNPDTTVAWKLALGSGYTSEDWLGKETPTGASGSVSGDRNAVGFNSPTHRVINGYSVPSLNGTNQYFKVEGKLGDYINAATGECSGIFVFLADSLDSYMQAGIFRASTSWGFVATNSLMWSMSTDGGGFMNVSQSISANTTMVGLFRYDSESETMEISTNLGQSWTTNAAPWGDTEVDAENADVFIGRYESAYLQGAPFEFRVTDEALPRADLAAYGKYLAAMYNLG